MVTAIDGVQQPSFTTFPLATGPYLSEDGHDGVLHISSPACPTQLLLNYSNWQDPTISGRGMSHVVCGDNRPALAQPDQR